MTLIIHQWICRDIACHVRRTRNVVIVMLLMITIPVMAQDATPTPTDDAEDSRFVEPPDNLTGEIPSDTGIYVTTQDFLNFRVGPGENFDAMDVIPPETTLMAIGRTADTRWVQVIRPDGVRGWVFVRFVVYSGDVVTLPVDGVNPVPFIRQAGAVGITTREAIIYDRVGNATTTFPAGTRLELTGRLGTGTWSRYQVLLDGELYWIGAWDVRVVSGSTIRLFDTAYLYPYGRVVRQLDDDIQATLNSLNAIEGIWSRIRAGEAVTCAFVPARVQRRVTDFDVRQEELFGPAVVALDTATANTNDAISAFEDACIRAQTEDGVFVTIEDVRNAENAIEEARIHLNLLDSMYLPLQRRDPLIRILSGQTP
jgi:hypothetical protein